MYLEYWKLKKQPFNSVPDPEMYFDMHQSVDSSVSELLFAVEEGNECLAVVIGPVGVGKTMCLRIVLNTLDKDMYRIAFLTNPDMTFPQLLREIVGQLEGKVCLERRKDRLLEEFNRILFETSDAGKRVVVFIDEGNAIKPHNLDSLRLLTNMQDDHQNLLTIILAGQPELGKRLEDPKRENLFQRIGVYCRVEGIDSRETMKDYIEHRLERAGLSGDSMFTEAAYNEIWKLSENGVPRLINKIAKLSLKAAETNRQVYVDADIVRMVGERFTRTYVRIRDARRTGTHREIKSAETAYVPVVKRKSELKIFSLDEREKIASQLATERLVNQPAVLDPFEVWTRAREEILRSMESGQQLKQAAG